MRTYIANLRQDESFQQLAKEFGTSDINKIAELWLKKYDGDYYSCKSPKKSRTLEYPNADCYLKSHYQISITNKICPSRNLLT